jgi:hypothetical protein
MVRRTQMALIGLFRKFRLIASLVVVITAIVFFINSGKLSYREAVRKFEKYKGGNISSVEVLGMKKEKEGIIRVRFKYIGKGIVRFTANKSKLPDWVGGDPVYGQISQVQDVFFEKWDSGGWMISEPLSKRHRD